MRKRRKSVRKRDGEDRSVPAAPTEHDGATEERTGLEDDGLVFWPTTLGDPAGPRLVQVGPRPPREPDKATPPRRRMATVLFTLLFFAGAALTAAAGNEVATIVSSSPEATALETQTTDTTATETTTTTGATTTTTTTTAESSTTTTTSSSEPAPITPAPTTDETTTAATTTAAAPIDDQPGGGGDPANAVVAEESAQVPTFFARVLGVSSFNVKAKATACSYCGVKPLDIMVVVDRTGSMCMDHNGNNDPACTDMNKEKAALKEFLSFLEPARQRVGLAVFPPATSVANRCSTPSDSNYNSTSSPYVVVPLSSNYASKTGVLNSSSQLVSTISCLKAAGNTSYAVAIEKAQAELNLHGRSGVQKVIVFFSDGAANTGPSYYASSSPYRKQPCHQGVTSAGGVKSGGTIIYSIGYDLNALDGGANTCRYNGYTGPLEVPAISAYSALQQIASSLDNFYIEPSSGDLSTVYLAIAADFSRGASGLIGNETE